MISTIPSHIFIQQLFRHDASGGLKVEEMDIVKHLVMNIGTRLSGSKGEKEAAKYLASKFKELGLEVDLYKYRFLGWELLEEPTLEMLSPRREKIPCAPNINSSSTPEE